MTRSTTQYVLNFIEFISTDIVLNTNLVTWNPIQESIKTIKNSDDKSVVLINKTYRSADGKIMIKTTVDGTTNGITSVSITICSSIIPLIKNDELSSAVLKLIYLLDTKLDDINLPPDTKAYIDSIMM